MVYYYHEQECQCAHYTEDIPAALAYLAPYWQLYTGCLCKAGKNLPKAFALQKRFLQGVYILS